MADARIRKWLVDAGVQKLRTTGDDNFISTCPFHKDKRPSFSMRSDNGLFLCYAQGCGVSGNLVNFLVSALNWKVSTAIEASNRMGVPSLEDPAVSFLPPYGKRKTHEEVNECKISEGHLGLYDFCPSYMVKRGFKPDILRKWDIGFDYGSHRVTIPVRAADRKLVGMSKRATLDEQDVKYLHLGFKRSRYLYGMHRLGGDAAVLTEGQFDVVAWDQMYHPFLGIDPLSTMSSRVSNRQIRWVARNVKEVYLAFDNDKDGRKATQRVGDALLPCLPRGGLFVLDAWPKGANDIADLMQCSRSEQLLFVTNMRLYDQARVEMPAVRRR